MSIDVRMNTSTSAPAKGGASIPGTSGRLTLHVSNQSFADDPVGITISIADQVVVDDTFYAEGGHNWITFELVLPAGDQPVQMVSSTGVRHSATINLPADQLRWAVIDYWHYPPDPRSFTFRVDDKPMYFA